MLFYGINEHKKNRTTAEKYLGGKNVRLMSTSFEKRIKSLCDLDFYLPVVKKHSKYDEMYCFANRALLYGSSH